MGVALIHADGRTDMAKLIGAFRNLGDAPNNGLNFKKYEMIYL